MKWRDLLNPLAVEKLRVQNLPDPGGAGGGSDVELAETTEAMNREFATDVPPYVPPLPVPLAHPVERPAGQRGESSEVWLVNPPTTLPGLGVLVAGGAAEKGSQFPINSLRIDNLTSQWIYFPENGAWIPPFWYGRVLRFNGSRVQRVRFETPTGLVALAAATTEVARVVFSEDYWDEQSGASVAGNLGAATGGAPNTGVVIYDDLSGLPAEVQTTADALVNQAGLVTDSFGFAYNGATWDRLRNGTGAAAGKALAASIQDGVGATLLSILGTPGASDAVANNTFNGVGSLAALQMYNGATWDRARVPNVFKQVASVAVGAGSTATVWTPATTGKKVRLMGWVMSSASVLTGDASATFFETSTTGTFMGETGFMSGTEPPYSANYGPGGPITSIASALVVAFSSTAVTLRGVLFGTEE